MRKDETIAPDQLMRPDLLSEIVLLGSGVSIFWAAGEAACVCGTDETGCVCTAGEAGSAVPAGGVCAVTPGEQSSISSAVSATLLSALWPNIVMPPISVLRTSVPASGTGEPPTQAAYCYVHIRVN